jgi:hypothetical protein
MLLLFPVKRYLIIKESCMYDVTDDTLSGLRIWDSI